MAQEDKKVLQEYIDIVQKVARVEHRRIPAHHSLFPKAHPHRSVRMSDHPFHPS